MFSGIIHSVGTVAELASHGSGATLALRGEPFQLSEAGGRPAPRTGDSVSVSGVCLTVTELRDGVARFDLATETLRRTTLGDLTAGSEVNLERSLRVGDGIDGHFVQGHVDAVGEVRSVAKEDNTLRMTISLPAELRGLVAPKGSVAIDGISLTVGEVSADSFSVYLIPHTVQATTLRRAAAGTRVNLEADCIARYLRALAKPYSAGGAPL